MSGIVGIVSRILLTNQDQDKKTIVIPTVIHDKETSIMIVIK